MYTNCTLNRDHLQGSTDQTDLWMTAGSDWPDAGIDTLQAEEMLASVCRELDPLADWQRSPPGRVVEAREGGGGGGAQCYWRS